MSHNRDLSAAAGQFGFHSSNIGIGSEAPRYPLDVHGGNLLVSGSAAGNIILEDRSVGDSSRPFALLASNDGNFTITSANRNVSGTTTSSAERLRIDSNGKIGINNTSPTAPLSIKVGSGGEYVQDFSGSATKQFGFFYDQNNWNAATFRIDEFDNNGTATSRLTITDGGKVGVGCDAEVDFQVRNGNGGILKVGGSGNSATGFQIQYNNSGSTSTEILTNYRATSSSASLKIDTGIFLVATGTSGTERLRITSDGKFGFNTSNPPRDYCFHSGQSDTNIQITNNTTGVDDSAGALIQQDGNDLYIWNKENSFMSLGTNAAERIRILSNGHVNIGGYRTSVSNCGLHVGRGSGGTAAGESVLAATLGNDSTMVSALLTVKNAGNRGTQGHVSGSPLAKFEFNNGTAFEIDKYGRRTLPYQPAFFVYRNQSSWTLAANDHFIFNTAELNVGGHYNTSNGRFTAPITGRYVFHFFSIYTGNANSDSIEMYKNGARMYGGDVHFTNSVGSAWDCVHYSRVIQLSTGDYVHMQTRTGHTFHGNHWGGWSGYMLG